MIKFKTDQCTTRNSVERAICPIAKSTITELFL